MTANTHISDEEVLDRIMELSNAMLRHDFDRAREIAGTIPLTPSVALQARHYMSKSEIVNTGYDMSLVEEELGADWYETP